MERVDEKLPISVVLLTRNEALNVGDCLRSCNFAQELIVIDDGSTDDTVAIAEELGAKVFHRPLNGDWGAQKTFGIHKASLPWVFLIDADERVTSLLQQSLRRAIQGQNKRAYRVQRENHFASGSATHGILRPDWVLRLLPREGAKVEGKVHEAVVTPFEVCNLQGRLIHFPYYSWDSYFQKFDKYTKVAAEKYLEEGRDCNFVGDILLRPIWAFIKVYLLNRGFLDGKLGFIFSVNHYFYTMAKYVRFYYLKKHGGRI